VAREERETVITLDDSVTKWHVATFQQKIINRMARIGIEPYLISKHGEHRYRVPYKQFLPRKKVEGRGNIEALRKHADERTNKGEN
jgi:hypothetical protein